LNGTHGNIVATFQRGYLVWPTLAPRAPHYLPVQDGGCETGIYPS